MKKIAALVVAAGAAAAVAQDSLSFNALPASVTPGTVVPVQVFANWGAPGIGFAGFEGKLNASGGTFGNAANGGLDPNFAILSGNGTASISAIVGQLPQIINPAFVNANPVLLFSADWTAPAALGSYTLGTTTTQFAVYTSSSGASRTGQPSNAAGTIEVIPAPSALALLGLGGLVAGRRRR